MVKVISTLHTGKLVDENYPVILLSENVYFGEAFEELLKSINDVKNKDEKIRLLKVAFKVNMKKAVEVYKNVKRQGK